MMEATPLYKQRCAAEGHPRMKLTPYCFCHDKFYDLAESPIEARLSSALRYFGLWHEQQYYVGTCRVDIAFPDVKVAVECDGHEWHSSKEQKARDAARDRFIAKEGWLPLRYTGSQIYQDPGGCALEIGWIKTGRDEHYRDKHRYGLILRALEWMGEEEALNGITDHGGWFCADNTLEVCASASEEIEIRHAIAKLRLGVAVRQMEDEGLRIMVGG